ncbi:hypothetical protein [Metallosphaera hakonensis]|uniref:hypothetical protein n=1 Tax=Metallosphaera hakonensis TaxID=79601 RepID=UPI000B1E34B7|nr:hypothetical protein [Metallosphaera hakonensis]
MFKPIVVASLPVRSREDIKRVDEIESDLVELRLDYAKDLPEPEEILSYKNKVLVTLRDRGEEELETSATIRRRPFSQSLQTWGSL